MLPIPLTIMLGLGRYKVFVLHGTLIERLLYGEFYFNDIVEGDTITPL